MVTLWPRPDNFVVLENTNISVENVKRLSDTAEMAWSGLINKNIKVFSEGFSLSFDAQVTMFPKMMNDKIAAVIGKYKKTALA